MYQTCAGRPSELRSLSCSQKLVFCGVVPEQGIIVSMDFSHTQALIFDLDGTLIDSERDLVESTNATLRHLGRPELPHDLISGYIGHGAPKLVASALGPGADADLQSVALQYFLGYYEDHKLVHTRAYPGVAEGLASLESIPMAVLTNKPLRMSTAILEALGLARHFSVIYGGDSFPAKKPDPAGVLAVLKQFGVSPENAMVIGDSEVDVQTARSAGTFSVVVNYGFGTNDRAAFPADIYIDSLTDLVSLLANQAK